MIPFAERLRLPKVFFRKDTWEHIQAHAEVFPLLPEAVEKAVIPREMGVHVIGVNMGREVGLSLCVQTTLIRLNDKAIFAYRNGRKKPSRVVMWGKGEESDTITLVVRNLSQLPEKPIEGDFNKSLLITAYIGMPSAQEPHYNKEAENIYFWSSHALIYDRRTMGKPFISTWGKILSLV